ncbi:hypothetical protein PoB_003168100 [Plakobranchus ocellatus]|uniref:Uncharacterized protein n=1 Tax=Plakobranchus ocellatus TaxID=259542 RepID=A0AAV4AEV0_9GAST|nr:hypothetical protein PoB_003168100 [Plakobranchus ocellatus]
MLCQFQSLPGLEKEKFLEDSVGPEPYLISLNPYPSSLNPYHDSLKPYPSTLNRVRFLKSSNSKRSNLPDKDFCFKAHKMVKDMIKLYGSETVTFLSVDDKCRVPIGLTAATKQAPLMMRVECKVNYLTMTL